MTGSRLQASLFIAAINAFIDFLGIGIIIPIAPFYSEKFGATPFEIALLFTSYSFPQLLLSPFWGKLSDMRGRRLALTIGLSGEVIAYLVFAFSPSLPFLYASRAIAGGLSANFAVLSSYVSDVTSEESRVRGLGVLGAATGMGFVFGPIVGGTLSIYGYRAPILLASALCLANLVLVRLFLVEPAKPAVQRQRVGFRKVFLYADYVYVTGLFVNLAFVGMQVTLALYGQRLYHWGSFQVGLVLGLVGLEGAVIQGGLIHRVTRGLGEKLTVVIGLVAFAVSYAMLSTEVPQLMAFLALALLGVGLSLSQPAANSIITKLVPRSDQGAAFGLVQSLTSLSNIMGQVFAGALFNYVSPFAPYAAGVFLVVCGLFVFSFYANRRTQTMLDSPLR